MTLYKFRFETKTPRFFVEDMGRFILIKAGALFYSLEHMKAVLGFKHAAQFADF